MPRVRGRGATAAGASTRDEAMSAAARGIARPTVPTLAAGLAGVQCPALFVAAPASGQGKTTITAALARLHVRLGRRVRVFKCGPDFLDPQVHAVASERRCMAETGHVRRGRHRLAAARPRRANPT